MKNIHQIAIKYVTHLVLNQQKMDNKQNSTENALAQPYLNKHGPPTER